MGKGKGPIVDWAIPLKKGATPFLFQGKKTKVLKKTLEDILKKLPV
jgi:ribosomal protein L16/L10AE